MAISILWKLRNMMIGCFTKKVKLLSVKGNFAKKCIYLPQKEIIYTLPFYAHPVPVPGKKV